MDFVWVAQLVECQCVELETRVRVLAQVIIILFKVRNYDLPTGTDKKVINICLINMCVYDFVSRILSWSSLVPLYLPSFN